MIYTWYRVFNFTDFLATGLVQRTYTLELEDLGLFDVLVTRGNYVSILFEDIFLPINFNDENPYSRDGYAVYLNADNDVFVGIEVDEA